MLMPGGPIEGRGGGGRGLLVTVGIDWCIMSEKNVLEFSILYNFVHALFIGLLVMYVCIYNSA